MVRDKCLERLSFLKRMEVAPLDVLGQTDLNQVVVAMLSNVTGNLGEARDLRRAQAPLAVHQLKVAGLRWILAHTQPGGKPLHADRLRQLVDVLEGLPRLEWVWANAVNRNRMGGDARGVGMPGKE